MEVRLVDLPKAAQTPTIRMVVPVTTQKLPMEAQIQTTIPTAIPEDRTTERPTIQTTIILTVVPEALIKEPPPHTIRTGARAAVSTKEIRIRMATTIDRRIRITTMAEADR